MGGGQGFQARNLSLIGIALLVLLGAGLLIRVTNHSRTLMQKTDRATVETPAQKNLISTETVDLRNGNIHLQIPIRALTKKP
jgi:multisubunit Na+/H+ antiporter MnhB subunit